MKHFVIKINEELCTGCGNCITACSESALQLVNGKATLVTESYCDGLGLCIGHCPAGALILSERDMPVDHGGLVFPETTTEEPASPLMEKFCGCPAALPRDLPRSSNLQEGNDTEALTHWPIQLRLISPGAACFKNASLLVAADCTAFAMGGDFHRVWLKERKLVIACPKLDEPHEDYVEKLRLLIDQACVKDITIMIMEVPCCKGLTHLVQQAAGFAGRNLPIREVIVGVEGNIVYPSSD
jgi:ferredoxin